MASSPRGFAVFLAIPLFVVGGCADDNRSSHPTDPDIEAPRQSLSAVLREPSALPTRPELPERTRELRIDLGEHEMRSDDGIAELVASIAAHDGRAFIGLKPETSPRTRDTGIVPSMGREERILAHEFLESRGAVLQQVYASFPAVYAVVPLDEVESLVRDPRINYIEPIGEMFLARVGAAALAPAMSQQDTSWGAFTVRAPQAWTDNRGHNASITILDTGVGQTHLMSGDGPVRLSDCLVGSAAFPTCFDVHGHGSHVAGIFGSRDDGAGYIGIAHYEGIFWSSCRQYKGMWSF